MSDNSKQEDPEPEGQEEKTVKDIDEREIDPETIQLQQLEELRQQVTSLHDMADQVKQVGENTSEMLMNQAQEAEDEEIQQQYVQLAEKARLAYRRIEYGDNTIVRGGL